MIIKRDFYFHPAQEMRTAHIWLPDDWRSPGKRYPVMYFFDGHNLFSDADATYGKSWGLGDFLRQWNKDIIIVGLECSHRGSERLNEYCPYTLHDSFLGDITGKGAQTMDWIVNQLKPAIDRDYPTWPHREATAIAGSSMGGLMAIWAAARYNRVFSKAACLSSAIRPCMDALRQDIQLSAIQADTRVYLSWGTEEAGGAKSDPVNDGHTPTAQSNGELSRLFRDRGAITRVYCQRYGRHCEADWEKQIPIFMPFLWF